MTIRLLMVVVVLKLKVVKMLVDRMRQGVYLSRKPQRAGLIAEETLTKVPVKYANFANVFSPDLAFKLPKHAGINDYPIDLTIQITCWRSGYGLSIKNS